MANNLIHVETLGENEVEPYPIADEVAPMKATSYYDLAPAEDVPPASHDSCLTHRGAKLNPTAAYHKYLEMTGADS